MYCRQCGELITNRNAAICVKCGVKLKNIMGINSNSNRKSKVTAIVLVLFLGVVGAHRFYLGYTGIGIVQLALGVIGLLTGITYIIVFVWAIIDFIMILTGKLISSNGVPLS